MHRKLQEDLGAMSMGYGQGQTEMARDTDRQAVAEAGLGGLRQEEEQKWSPAGKEPEREPRYSLQAVHPNRSPALHQPPSNDFPLKTQG